jgi:PPOX class probable F420-dependent enzyme
MQRFVYECMTDFDAFKDQWAILLTTYRRDGTPVGTPVSLVVDGDHAFLRSPGTGWKVKRMRRNPSVEVAPCTWRGRPTGPSMPALARPVEGEEARRAARALRRKHPVLQGIVVPLTHRLMRCGTAYFELAPNTKRVASTGKRSQASTRSGTRRQMPDSAGSAP